MDKDLHDGFLISDESDSNDHYSYMKAEYLISTPEVEILKKYLSVTLISEEEYNEMFPEGARLLQYINEVI